MTVWEKSSVSHGVICVSVHAWRAILEDVRRWGKSYGKEGGKNKKKKNKARLNLCVRLHWTEELLLLCRRGDNSVLLRLSARIRDPRHGHVKFRHDIQKLRHKTSI